MRMACEAARRALVWPRKVVVTESRSRGWLPRLASKLKSGRPRVELGPSVDSGHARRATLRDARRTPTSDAHLGRPPRPLHSGGFSARGCRRARRTAQRHRQPARRGRRHFETRASRSVAMGFVGGTFFFIFLEVAFVFFVNWFFKAQHRQCVPPPRRASPLAPLPRRLRRVPSSEA